jgi:predicted transcriptional regulator
MAKYTIDFDDDFDKTLSELKDSTDATTKADVIRRAVASYKFLKSQTAADKEVAITDKSGKVEKSVVLP